jgi:pilus assembly protein CpaE
MTVPCLRQTQRLIKAIQDTTARQARPAVIVNRFEQKMFDNGIRQADVEELLGEFFVGGIANNYRLVREAVDRGVPLQAIDANANVIRDLRRIITPEAAAPARAKSLFGLGLLRRRSA